ncbi:MAG: histidine--tRNA ligase [Cytophagales bacterium]|nr:histidine--tRNA ligase [Cytophagales bacterium]
MQKPSNARGTRDFGPKEMVKRNYVFSIIKKHFERFGFQNIETPSIENLSTLMGKYGEEGDQLLFKILNSGDFLKEVSQNDIDLGYKTLSQKIVEKGLRYDLTVPFARFVSMNRSEIAFPFKRYQIQPVWRADRPQKGRYREFYQCDADIVGSDSLVNEAELVSLFQSIFSELNLNVQLLINSRKVLTGIVDVLGMIDKFSSFAIALDKLDKVGWDVVKNELSEQGFEIEKLNKLKGILEFEGSNDQKVANLKSFLADSEIGLAGLKEIEDVLSFSADQSNINFDVKLARGLSYYTGLIFEGKALDLAFGSIVGGGRYDNLTSSFGLPNMSGVGISFGIERIIDVMDTLELLPAVDSSACKVLFTYFDPEGQLKCLGLANSLRASGIACEVYPDIAKIKKSFEYADKKGIKFVAVIGSEEIKSGLISIKDMMSGSQEEFTLDQLSKYLS